MTSNPDELMGLDEAAAWMKVDAEALRIQVQKGIVPARRVGEDWVLSRSALLEWVRSAPSHPPAQGGRPVIDGPTSKRNILASAGIWADQSLEEIEASIADIYAARRATAEEPE